MHRFFFFGGGGKSLTIHHAFVLFEVPQKIWLIEWDLSRGEVRTWFISWVVKANHWCFQGEKIQETNRPCSPDKICIYIYISLEKKCPKMSSNLKNQLLRPHPMTYTSSKTPLSHRRLFRYRTSFSKLPGCSSLRAGCETPQPHAICRFRFFPKKTCFPPSCFWSSKPRRCTPGLFGWPSSIKGLPLH